MSKTVPLYSLLSYKVQSLQLVTHKGWEDRARKLHLALRGIVKTYMPQGSNYPHGFLLDHESKRPSKKIIFEVVFERPNDNVQSLHVAEVTPALDMQIEIKVTCKTPLEDKEYIRNANRFIRFDMFNALKREVPAS